MVADVERQRLDALLGNEVVHRLLRLPYLHFERTPTGVISERLRQLDTIRAFFTGQMPVVLVDVCFMFVFVGTLMFISPILGMVTLGAVPFFLLAGEFMNAGGLSRRIVNFAMAWVGHFRGGLGYVAVIAAVAGTVVPDRAAGAPAIPR